MDIEKEMERTRGRENTNTDGCHKFWSTLKSYLSEFRQGRRIEREKHTIYAHTVGERNKERKIEFRFKLMYKFHTNSFCVFISEW